MLTVLRYIPNDTSNKHVVHDACEYNRYEERVGRLEDTYPNLVWWQIYTILPGYEREPNVGSLRGGLWHQAQTLIKVLQEQIYVPPSSARTCWIEYLESEIIYLGYVVELQDDKVYLEVNQRWVEL